MYDNGKPFEDGRQVMVCADFGTAPGEDGHANDKAGVIVSHEYQRHENRRLLNYRVQFPDGTYETFYWARVRLTSQRHFDLCRCGARTNYINI